MTEPAHALDAPTRALIRVAAALADGADDLLGALLDEARAADAPGSWLNELVLAGVLFAGFPRALVLARAVRERWPEAAASGDASDYAAWPAWRERGEALCRRTYGSNYERLRSNVAKLHPALDAWIVMDGYGRTLSRPGLDPGRRELCSIAMLVPQRTPRQLHSHLRGALNVGASAADVEAVFEALADLPCVSPERLAEARRQWLEVRP